MIVPDLKTSVHTAGTLSGGAGGGVANDLIRVFSVGVAATMIVAVAVISIRWWRDNRKPGCHCWACRRMNKAEAGDREVVLELRDHFHLWATGPAVEPDRERS